MSKAFDTLSHNLLLSKLQGLGFGSGSLSWIRSYPTDRTQQVKMNDILSDKCIVEAGVPQGSILGPVLFIAFTTDFNQHFEDCKITAYADDTQLLVEGKSVDELKQKIESTLEKAQSWFSTNSLKINPTKSEIMVFGLNRTPDHNIEISIVEDGTTTTIKTSKQMKVLGVNIDDKLSWESHIKKIKRQTHNIISNLARTTSVLPLSSRRTLYDALVAPYFNYCDVVWDGTSKKCASDLQSSGNFAARSLLGLKKRSPATEARMMPLSEKRKVHVGVFIHKAVHKNAPRDITERYGKLLERGHSHDTRAASRGDLATVAHRTSRDDQSTQQRAVKCWNGLPVELKNMENTSTFKNNFQKLLLNCFKNENACSWCASPQ